MNAIRVFLASPLTLLSMVTFLVSCSAAYVAGYIAGGRQRAESAVRILL